MAALGTFTLLAAFLVCSYAAAVSVAGARRRSSRLVESGVGAFYVVTALMLLASAVIIHAFVTEDYSIRYVNQYSDSAQPLFYQFTSYWGGLDGSIMFWVTLLAIFGSLAVRSNREQQRELIPYVVAVISVVQMFFLFVMIVHKNPFSTYLIETPTDGRGLNPLLQNFYMAIHPPSLYIGFVGMTIPFAFAMAALITGHLDDSWLRAVRRWTMTAWIFLSLGLTLGMIWAYEELGWGGYWGWDPVENAALLPWFTATAFLHSVMVQERRSMLRVWNMTLVILTFFLTIFGTFMTRSGVVQSVHAFGQDTALAWMFIVFMVGLLVFSFGLVIYRLPLLRARNELESWVSREAAFLANNWILLFSAVFVLFATMFPTLSEAVTGDRLTVGPPFFTKWMLPIGLILLTLTGIGPLLAWRQSSLSNLRYQFTWPITSALVTGGALYALGFRVWVSGLAFSLCAFVAGTITQEFVRGARVRREATGTDPATALVGLVARSRRRYGGYIVHVGIVLMFLGFAGSGYKLDSQVLMRPGESHEIGRYTVRYDRLSQTSDAQKQMITAHMTVFRDGELAGEQWPARWFFFKHESEPTTEVAMHRTIAEDLYIVLAGYEFADQAASFQITVNPLVNWIWFGFAVLALGTGLAMLPESAFAYGTATVPKGAATASTLLLAAALMLGSPAALAAQQLEGALQEVNPATSELELDLRRSLVCMCGSQGCGKKILAECTCADAAATREELSGLVAEGMTRDEVLRFYVDKYNSQEALAAPLDQGFNRLAWAFPYLLALGAAVALGGALVRWTRRGTPMPAAALAGGGVDEQLEARLDDELRDLD